MPTNGLKIGLALGSGGAKGLSHIGILKVLEENEIIPDLITGASMGAIIGAGYSLGMPIKEIEEKACEFFTLDSIFSPTNFHYFHESLIRIEDIRKVFYEFVGDSTFADCKIPFMALGLDLEEGEEVRMTEGRLLEAVEAASAIPGIFPPVFVDERYMVDGGLLNPTPVDYLRESKMDIVIGVHTENLTARQYISAMVWDKFYKKPDKLKKQTKRGMLEQAKLNMTLMINILMRTIEVARKLNEKIAFLTGHPDIIIEPYTMDIGMLQFERIEEAIKYGEEAAKKQIPKLKKIIRDKKKDLKK
ncbi:patatin-like phospholipase family protein [bacterium]|nr:patatin-like phospholipase family protein [bacterium]